MQAAKKEQMIICSGRKMVLFVEGFVKQKGKERKGKERKRSNPVGLMCDLVGLPLTVLVVCGLWLEVINDCVVLYCLPPMKSMYS